MKFLVIQPHLDDAFFSITETALTWVEDGHQVGLITVFGGIPRAEHVGVERELKHQVMWGEYEAALAAGPFTHVLALAYLDHAARSGQVMLRDVVRSVEDVVGRQDPDVLVMPQGIHHPDHRITRESSPGLKRASRWYYDELPYFAMYPDEAYDPEEDNPVWMEREGSRPHLAEKQEICRLFASQIGDTEERCLWVPERVWRPR